MACKSHKRPGEDVGSASALPTHSRTRGVSTMTYRDISDFVGTVTSGIRLASALDLIGLERRRGTMSYMAPTISAFGVGIAVGAGLGLLFAPKPGARLRDDITKKV